ncbi:MAG: hypothetical protein ACYC8S_01790 [Minisyncoccota bacterium]
MPQLTEADTKYIKGWSWGGFVGTWVFLFVHKQRSWGWKIFGLTLVIWFLQFALLLNIPGISKINLINILH